VWTCVSPGIHLFDVDLDPPWELAHLMGCLACGKAL